MPTNKKMRSRSSKKSMKGGFKVKTSKKANEYMKQLQIAALSPALAREKKIKNNRLKLNNAVFKTDAKYKPHKTRYNHLKEHISRAPVMWTGFEPNTFKNSKEIVIKREGEKYKRSSFNNRSLNYSDPTDFERNLLNNSPDSFNKSPSHRSLYFKEQDTSSI